MLPVVRLECGKFILRASLLPRVARNTKRNPWGISVTRSYSKTLEFQLPNSGDSKESVALRIRQDVAEEKLDKVPSGRPFSSLSDAVSPGTLRAISEMKISHMSPVQEEVLGLLPALAEPYDSQKHNTDDSETPPRDLLVRAKTGTGKTLAFLVPVIENRRKELENAGKRALKDAGVERDETLVKRAQDRFARDNVGVLIVSPTRELAMQIAAEAHKLTRFQKGFGVQLFIGQVSKGSQMREWMKSRRDIVVGTPGRLRDVFENEPEVQRAIQSTRTLILDEADTLLDMGFRADLDGIIERLPSNPARQNFLFSATINPAVRQVAKKMLDKNHAYINTVSEDDSPVHAHIPQFYTTLPTASDLIPHLARLIALDQLKHPDYSKIMVFAPTAKMAQTLYNTLRYLSHQIFPSDSTTLYELHSRKSQDSRINAAKRFRTATGGCHVLVTTDVSARGVDYPGITNVIQCGIPSSAEQYVHRVGRTGRAGSTGEGNLLMLPWESGFLTWQLTEVPLRSRPLNDVKAQLETVAPLYDPDPRTFLAHNCKDASPNGKTVKDVITRFQPRKSLRLEEYEQVINEFLPQLDPEDLSETYLSIMGYYFSRASEMRVDRNVIYEGCKDMARGAFGLETPPYISPKMMDRFGLGRHRSELRQGSRSRSSTGNHGNHWVGRGSSSAKRSWKGDGDASPRWRQSGDREDSYQNTPRHSRDRYSDRQTSFGGRSYGSARFGDSDRSQRSSFSRRSDGTDRFEGRRQYRETEWKAGGERQYSSG